MIELVSRWNLLWKQSLRGCGNSRYIHFYFNFAEICPSQQLIFWPRPHWTLKARKLQDFHVPFQKWRKQTWNYVLTRDYNQYQDLHVGHIHMEDLLLSISVYWWECLHHHTPLWPFCRVKWIKVSSTQTFVLFYPSLALFWYL